MKDKELRMDFENLKGCLKDRGLPDSSTTSTTCKANILGYISHKPVPTLRESIDLIDKRIDSILDYFSIEEYTDPEKSGIRKIKKAKK